MTTSPVLTTPPGSSPGFTAPTLVHCTPATRPSASSTFSALDFFSSTSFPEAMYGSVCFCSALTSSIPAMPSLGRWVLGWECPPSWEVLSRGRRTRPLSHSRVPTLPSVNTLISGLLFRPPDLSVSLVKLSTESGLFSRAESTALIPEDAQRELPPMNPSFSMSVTVAPRSSNVSAAESPASPPPTTTQFTASVSVVPAASAFPFCCSSCSDSILPFVASFGFAPLVVPSVVSFMLESIPMLGP
mmetsp:Transcript_28543/g.39425  ORF Transcript_28543/g.39425 Transcript_28543/m.39425 type:complete len:244 (-) Transcript_28543:224-955(-)